MCLEHAPIRFPFHGGKWRRRYAGTVQAPARYGAELRRVGVQKLLAVRLPRSTVQRTGDEKGAAPKDGPCVGAASLRYRDAAQPGHRDGDPQHTDLLRFLPINGPASVCPGSLHKSGVEPAPPAEENPEPAVPVRRSIRPDSLVCLVCRKPEKLLKRHLGAAHGLTPTQYRERFDLKPDYPMAAPSYTERRRELALRIGLGRPKKSARRRRRKPMTESLPGEVGQ
jgi:predicted transcriptional regulator